MTVPRPPSVVGATAVNGSFTSDSDVGLFIGIDAGTEIVAVYTLPACRNNRVEVGLEGKLQNRILLHHEVDMAQHRDGTRQECAGRNNHASASLLGAGSNGFVDSLLVFGSRVSGLGAILGNQEILLGK